LRSIARAAGNKYLQFLRAFRRRNLNVFV